MRAEGRFHDRVVIVTGGATGIGRSTAGLFATEGAKVVIAGRRQAMGLTAQSEIRSLGGDALYVQADVSRASDCAEIVQTAVKTYGRLDILVNNAAVAVFHGAEDTTEEEWDRVLDTNLKGPFMLSKLAIPFMRAQGGGAIINISSVHSVATVERITAYAAAKGGLNSLTQQMAHDLARDGIRVVALIVGRVDTDLGSSHVESRESPDTNAADASDLAILGRLARPEEVGSVVLFLASEGAAFINATCITVDGGLLARLDLD